MIDACKISDLKQRAIFRSKTFFGIAKAMADQWGKFVIAENRCREDGTKVKTQ